MIRDFKSYAAVDSAHSPETPTNKTDDMLFVGITTDTGDTINTPTGWTENYTKNTNGVRYTELYRRTTVDDETIPELIQNGTDGCNIVAVSIEGVDWTNGPFGNTANGVGSDATVEYGTITTSQNGSLVLFIGSMDADTVFNVKNKTTLGKPDSGDASMVIGFDYYPTSGTATGIQVSNASAADGWQGRTLEILGDTANAINPIRLANSPGSALDPTLYAINSTECRGVMVDSGVLIDEATVTDYSFDASTDTSGVGTGSADTGTAGSGDGSTTFTDATKAWTVDEHKGRYFTTSTGLETSVTWIILSNTATTLTLHKVYGTTESAITYNIAHAVRLNVSTDVSKHLRVYQVRQGANTAPTGMTDQAFFYLWRIDATTITLLTANIDEHPEVSGDVRAPLQISATGTGLIDLKESGLTQITLSSSFNISRINKSIENGVNYIGSMAKFTTPYDMSSDVFAYTARIDRSGWARLLYVFIDSDGDWASWTIVDNSALPTDRTSLIDVANNTTHFKQGNTFNGASVSYMGVFGLMKDANSRPSFESRAPFFIQTITPVGGDANSPGTFDKVLRYVENDIDGTVSTSPTQYNIFHNFVFGNGTTDLYFDDPSKSLQIPPLADGVTTFQAYLNDLGVGHYLTASSTVKLTAGASIGSEAPWNFTVNALSSPSATIDYNGGTLINPAVSINSFDSFDGTSFFGGTENIHSDATITNCVIGNNKTAGGAFKLTTTHNLSNTTFSNNTYALYVDTAGTYTMNGVKFSNNAYDLNPTHTTGTVTINIGGGGDTPTLDGTWTDNGSGNFTKGSATVQINNSVTVKVTAQDSASAVIQGARVFLKASAGGSLSVGTVILNADSDVNGVVQDTGFNFAGNQPVVGWVRKGTSSPYYKQSPISGTITASGFDSIISLVSDE